MRALFHLALICLVAALSACATALGPTLDIAALRAELERLEQQGFAGVVLVARGDEVLLRNGYGRRVPGGGEPITPDTVFPLESVTKPFTAGTVLALAADGELALDEPVGTHLESLRPPWADIPLDALLTHTGGLAAEIVNRAWEGHPRFEPVDRDSFLQRVQEFEPDHPPGEHFNYSNVGYSVLGAVVEVVSGLSWEDYLYRRLLAPAGIEEIGFRRPGWDAGDVAVGRRDGEARPTFYDRPSLEDGVGWHLRATGDLHATADAVFAWWRALAQHEFLDERRTAEWLQPRVPEPDGSRYGYGWQFRDSPWGPTIGHTGGDRVYAVDFTWFPRWDLLVYVATAEAEFEADVIRDRLHRRLFGGG